MVKRKLWSSGRILGSQLEGRGINPRPMLYGSGVKAMSGSNIGSQMGHTKKYLKKLMRR